MANIEKVRTAMGLLMAALLVVAMPPDAPLWKAAAIIASTGLAILVLVWVSEHVSWKRKA